MISEYNTPQVLNTLPACGNKAGFEAFIDSLNPEHTYLFKCTHTAASEAGIASLYGIMTVHIYSTQAAILIFQPLTASANIYKLRKYQGAWDSSWTQVQTTTVQ